MIFFLLVLVTFPSILYSQNSSLGNWLIYIGNWKVNPDFNWHHEIQYRNYNAIGDLEQLLVRTGLGYDLTSNNNNFLLGYGYIFSQNYIPNTDDKADINEHRIFQQFINWAKIGIISMQHRFRFEERFIREDSNKIIFCCVSAIFLLLIFLFTKKNL